VKSGLAFYPPFLVKLWELNSCMPLEVRE
jgi:hypothetical protein